LGFILKREYAIYKTLKLLAKQRVALILQPGNVWVIEKSLPETEQNLENIQTCIMRGWVEILHESVRSGNLKSDGSLPDGRLFQNEKPIYKLTDSGWNAIHRTHYMGLLSITISLVGVAIVLL
jgi:hypothetical protein